MTIAAFDCDGTLIRGDATRRFLLELRGPFGLDSDLLRLAPRLIAWRLGRCSTAAFKQALLDRCLQAMSATQRREVLERLPVPLLAALARHLEVERIATGCSDPLEARPGTPFRLTTPNCKRPEKISRLAAHLGALPAPDQLEAYGDSRGDRELLQASGRPHWRSFTAAPAPATSR